MFVWKVAHIELIEKIGNNGPLGPIANYNYTDSFIKSKNINVNWYIIIHLLPSLCFALLFYS